MFFHINAEKLRHRLSQLPLIALPKMTQSSTESDGGNEIELEPPKLNEVIDRIVEYAAGVVNAAVTNYCRRPFEETSARSNHSTTLRRNHEDFENEIGPIIGIMAAKFKVVCDLLSFIATERVTFTE